MGTLLGDTYCHLRESGNCRLKVDHGGDQKDYVLWLHSKLLRLCQKTQPPVVKPPRHKVPKGSVLFYTDTTSVLNFLHPLFYKPNPEYKPNAKIYKDDNARAY